MRNWDKKRYFFTIALTILCLSGMMISNHFSHYNSMKAKMQNQGMGSLREVKERIEKHLTKNIDIVELTAFSLEYMMENNASSGEMEDFLAHKSIRYKEETDSSFAGLYGVVNGTFLGGTGWIAGADYVPQERDWYIRAKEKPVETVLVSPYLDVKTNTMKMSVSRMLSDKESVISIDITLDEIQKFIEDMSLMDADYTFLVDEAGQVISHSNTGEIGKNYRESPQMAGVLDAVFEQEQAYFAAKLDGKKYQICANRIMEDWYLVAILDRGIFLEEVKLTLVRNIIFYGIISFLIIFFYVYSFKSIQHSIQLERDSNEKIEQANMNLIRALVRTIDAKDRYTNGHSVRVAEYARKIAKELGKSEEEQKTIYYAGLLHDIGKIRVPVEIINKPDKLTDEEFNQIKIHPVTGYYILKDIYDDKTIAMGVKFHHERYDGNGYPSGLDGENIPEIARILAVVDTYDAMASNRSYRKALPQEKVREEIEKGKGTQFDPEIADIMLQMIEEDRGYYLRETASMQKTVLVVDDELMSIRLIELFMKNESICRIENATSGEEALKLLEKMPVHLILLDVEMPEMNGFETLSKIREKYDIPVIFMTGNKDIDTIQKSTDLGVVDYISKPFTAFMLKEIIHSMLNE